VKLAQGQARKKGRKKEENVFPNCRKSIAGGSHILMCLRKEILTEE